MFKYNYKKINFALGCATLFTSVLFHNLSSASDEVSTKIVDVNDNEINTNNIVLENNQISGFVKSESNDISPESTDVSQIENGEDNISENNGLDLNYVSFETSNNEGDEQTRDSNLRIVRMVSISFFLLLIVPLGIFYPFFLFYKNLLGVDHEDYEDYEDYEESVKALENNETNFSISFNSANFHLENNDFVKAKDSHQATVSKLQIAFSPQANGLRQQLSQISSSVDMNDDGGLVELMNKTISVLIAQKYFTHVSHSSIALPLDHIKTEFDVFSCTERSKFMSEEFSLVSSGRYRQQSAKHKHQDFYSYIVVTLILCTSHHRPLFNQILTKEQLAEELIQLSQMGKDDLLKFELLWNPQSEDKYLNNNRLLMEYSDMNRLF